MDQHLFANFRSFGEIFATTKSYFFFVVQIMAEEGKLILKLQKDSRKKSVIACLTPKLYLLISSSHIEALNAYAKCAKGRKT